MSNMTSSPVLPADGYQFDIDNYLNWAVPRNRLNRLPRPIASWLGCRPPGAKPQATPPAPVSWLSALVGGFVGIAIVTNVYHALPLLSGHQVPTVIASFGAAAILEYNAIESPLAQPRNLIVGHVLSAVIGVGITKGFEHLPPQRFEQLRWLAGSLSVGVASVAMSMTKTVHPPAGATALLASTSADITVLGWWLVPLILLASTLMMVSALVVNNITRRWPIYWWTPVDLSPKRSNGKRQMVSCDLEKTPPKLSTDTEADSIIQSTGPPINHVNSDSTLHHSTHPDSYVVVSRDHFTLPGMREPDARELEAIRILQQRLMQAGQAQPAAVSS